MRPLLFLAFLLHSPVAAQLRPPEPLDLALLDSGRVAAASLGVAWLPDQRAGLAGVEGTLLELGTFSLAARTGRVVLGVSGTAFRSFAERERVRLPYGGAEPDPDGTLRDVGDVRVWTAVRAVGGPEALAGLRFGTLLPTTDNEVGLERDRTDFFALLFGGGRHRGWRVSAEAGLGIHGSHYADGFEQVDMLLYTLSVLGPGPISPWVVVTGQADGLHGWRIPGNENLGEARAGVRVGRRRWLDVAAVRGFEDSSPSWGIFVAAGAAW